VGKLVGRAFNSVRGADAREDIFHVLPHGDLPWDYGTTLFAGSDMEERREILARLADVFIVVEGGPGTAHEATVALMRTAVVIPIGRLGGVARELHRSIRQPMLSESSDWNTLSHSIATVGEVVAAVTHIVRVCLPLSAGPVTLRQSRPPKI